MCDKQVKKVLSELSLSLSQWKLYTAEGKIFLNGILEKCYPVQTTEAKNADFEEEIQIKCDKLALLLSKWKSFVVILTISLKELEP